MSHAVGDALPPLEKTFTPVDLMAYGAATWDWYQVHYDVENARALGFPAPFVDGQNWGALFAKQLRGHFGPQAFVSRMALRYHAMAFAGDTVTGSAEITAIRDEPGARVVEVAQKLEKAGAAVASCKSEVRLPA